MAKVKKSVVQRDFSIMELRDDFLDADGDEMRARSLKGALNMRAMASRVVQSRPGMFYMRSRDLAATLTEIRPADGKIFAVMTRRYGIDVIDQNATTVATFDIPGWNYGRDAWVVPARERTILGHPSAGLHILTYNNGSWSVQPWTFATAEGGEIAQPYWAFRRDVSIKPSARSGVVTITASDGIFAMAYIGERIRYGGREILITGYNGPRSLTGRVIGVLPPSFEIRVATNTDYRVGDVVIGEDTGFSGFVVQRVGGLRIRVMTLEYADGPDIDEKLTSPTGGSKVLEKTEITPLPSTIWDEPLMSAVRGYPRSCSAVSGRLVFVDFPQIPDMIAMSSARDIQDFRVGAADDDAITRQEGDGSPRFLHAINAGDLLLLSDRGCYYVPIRDNGVLTPSSFNAVLFDNRGSSTIRPVHVDDGVVFVEANGQTISAALLDGNIYLKWSVRPLTLFHNHLINSPTDLCGPSIASKEAEKYLFVVNSDGTLAAMSWSMKLGEEIVGFSPWQTSGQIRHVAPIFGDYWAVVDRWVNGATVRMIERFDYGAYVDSSVFGPDAQFQVNLTVNGANLTVNGDNLLLAYSGARHLPSRELAVLNGPHFAGMTTATAQGQVDTLGVPYENVQVGLPFTAEAEVWPVELIESPRVGMLKARVMQMSVSVQNTTAFQIICNGETRTVGGYSAGALFSNPPELHTKVFKAPVMGQRDHPSLSVRKHIPGPFRVLAIGQEVQG